MAAAHSLKEQTLTAKSYKKQSNYDLTRDCNSISTSRFSAGHSEYSQLYFPFPAKQYFCHDEPLLNHHPQKMRDQSSSPCKGTAFIPKPLPNASRVSRFAAASVEGVQATAASGRVSSRGVCHRWAGRAAIAAVAACLLAVL